MVSTFGVELRLLPCVCLVPSHPSLLEPFHALFLHLSVTERSESHRPRPASLVHSHPGLGIRNPASEHRSLVSTWDPQWPWEAPSRQVSLLPAALRASGGGHGWSLI